MKIINKFIDKSQSGFTLVELMIATGIFSSVLVLGLTGFVGIGRIYYKGITITQTNQTASQLFNEVTANIRLAKSGVQGPSDAGQGRQYYCIGGHRYTFMRANMVSSSSNSNTDFGLLEDTLPATGCGDPFSGPGRVPLNNPAEVLSNQMRVLNFDISSVADNLYEVNITVASGQDNTLTSPINSNSQCKLQLNGNDFCAITKLSTIVYEGN